MHSFTRSMRVTSLHPPVSLYADQTIIEEMLIESSFYSRHFDVRNIPALQQPSHTFLLILVLSACSDRHVNSFNRSLTMNTVYDFMYSAKSSGPSCM